MKTIELYFDGSCLVNPNGAMGFGALLIDLDSKTRTELSDGEPASKGNTNNVAEYRALLMGLDELDKVKDANVKIMGDSKLVISQISGDWKIKNKPNAKSQPKYAPYALQAREKIVSLFKNNNIRFNFEWIPREQNEDCDSLSNRFHNKDFYDYSQMVKAMKY